MEMNPHPTRQHQRPHPTPDRLGLRFADSSPSPHLVLGPNPQGGHYSSPLHWTRDISQRDIIRNLLQSPVGYLWPSARGRGASTKSRSWPVRTRSCTPDCSDTGPQGSDSGRASAWFPLEAGRCELKSSRSFPVLRKRTKAGLIL